MKNFARMYDSRQAIIVHAAATNYRDRSHFDGQDVLESGMLEPGHTESGWLNRAVATLPKAEQVGGGKALAVGYVAPLIMRGPAPVLGWAPSGLSTPTDEFTDRVLNLYDHTDLKLAATLREGLDADRMASRMGMDQAKSGGDAAKQMRSVATGAARLMADDNGPRIGALATDGWDTHAGEGGATGRLAQLLDGLDQALAAFETELGPKWKDTVIVAVTEFGRTVHVNGTVGTDHGTGTVAFLAGGARRRRARDRRLAGLARNGPLREPRLAPDDRCPRRAEGRAARPSRIVRRCARPRRVPRHAGRRSDERADRRLKALAADVADFGQRRPQSLRPVASAEQRGHRPICARIGGLGCLTVMPGLVPIDAKLRPIVVWAKAEPWSGGLQTAEGFARRSGDRRSIIRP